MPKNPQLENSAMDIPDHVIDRIARCLLLRMLAYFESEEGQRELAAQSVNDTVNSLDAAPCNT